MPLYICSCTMSLPPFKPCIPCLLPSSNPILPSNNNSEQDEPRLPISHCIIGTWNMIASSSSMWQDNKHSITITYTTEDSGDAHKVHDLAGWQTERSDSVSSTKGISTPLEAQERCRSYNWRGAGWLRMIATRWEIVGVGVTHVNTGVNKDGRAGTEERFAVLVTLVQKTLFSPQALSIYVKREHFHTDNQEAIFATVKGTLQDLGCEALQLEIEKLRTIPQTNETN